MCTLYLSCTKRLWYFLLNLNDDLNLSNVRIISLRVFLPGGFVTVCGWETNHPCNFPGIISSLTQVFLLNLNLKRTDPSWNISSA